MIIAFIPARSGSKGIKDKNIKELNGKPLIAYSIESAFKSGVDRVIVNSDSEEYLKIAEKYGALGMLRPKELAEDKTSMYEVLKNEIPKIEEKPEVIVLLSPTVPLRKNIHIKTGISFFVANMNEYDSLMAVQRVPHEYNPAQVIVSTPLGLRMSDGRKIKDRITSRQKYPDAYVTSQGLYIFKTSNLEKGSIYGEKTMLLECEKSIDINTTEDWILLENEILKSQLK